MIEKLNLVRSKSFKWVRKVGFSPFTRCLLPNPNFFISKGDKLDMVLFRCFKNKTHKIGCRIVSLGWTIKEILHRIKKVIGG